MPSQCPDCSNLIPDALVACPNCGHRPEPLLRFVESPQMQVAQHSSSEIVIHQDAYNTITTSRAVFGAVTYPVRNITSVKITVIPANTSPGVVLLVVGCICFFIGVYEHPLFYLMAVITFGLGALSLYRAKAIYQLQVGNSGTEFTGARSYSRQYIERLHHALNQAIVNYR